MSQGIRYLGQRSFRSSGQTDKHTHTTGRLLDLNHVTHNVVDSQGRNHWGSGGGVRTPPKKKIGRTTPTFYVAVDCSARNWVYHPYFVLYNNLDQGIGPPNFENVVAPLSIATGRCTHNVIAYHMSSTIFRLPPAGGDMIQHHHCYEAAETQQQSSRLYIRHLRNSTRLLIIKQTPFKNKQNITMAKILLLQHNQHFLP